MSFLISHWHCILPLAVLLVVYFVFSKSSDDKPKNTGASSGSDESSVIKSIDILDKKFTNGEITESEYLRKKSLLR